MCQSWQDQGPGSTVPCSSEAGDWACQSGLTPWAWLNRYACVNQWEDVHSVAVVLKVFCFGVWVLFHFVIFLINKACWPLFSCVV